MPWPAVKENSRTGLIAAIAVAACLLVIVPSAHAVDTEIGAKVCMDSPNPAVIDITEPNDDSVTSQATITLRGSVDRVSQVVISVDGVYDSSVAVASDQAVFSANVTLTKGTHTVSVAANEICGGPDGTDEIVLTYEPAVTPSTGGTTPTTVEPTGEQTGVVSSDETIPAESAPTVIEQIPVIGPVYNMVKGLSETIGLQETFTNGQIPAAAGAARVGLTVVALTTVVMASALAPVAAQALPGVSEVFNVASHRSMIYLGWVIRGVGLVAMAMAYFI